MRVLVIPATMGEENRTCFAKRGAEYAEAVESMGHEAAKPWELEGFGEMTNEELFEECKRLLYHSDTLLLGWPEDFWTKALSKFARHFNKPFRRVNIYFDSSDPYGTMEILEEMWVAKGRRTICGEMIDALFFPNGYHH